MLQDMALLHFVCAVRFVMLGLSGQIPERVFRVEYHVPQRRQGGVAFPCLPNDAEITNMRALNTHYAREKAGNSL